MKCVSRKGRSSEENKDAMLNWWQKGHNVQMLQYSLTLWKLADDNENPEFAERDCIID